MWPARSVQVDVLALARDWTGLLSPVLLVPHATHDWQQADLKRRNESQGAGVPTAVRLPKWSGAASLVPELDAAAFAEVETCALKEHSSAAHCVARQ